MFGALVSAALVFLAAAIPTSAAKTFLGTPGPDRLIGTPALDVLLGLGGKDYLDGRRGNDFLAGGTGSDMVLAGPGADRLQLAFDGASDDAICGTGHDIVTADLSDKTRPACEVVSRQLSRDPFRATVAQAGTEVEPDSFSHGSVVVAAFQIGRFIDGGALAMGFSTSRDTGKSWHSGFLPSLSRVTKPAGRAEFVADPSVAYDAVHRLWLVASLAALPRTDAVLISRSRRGLSWRAPVAAVRGDGLDKPWIACDNWARSPHRGSCYLTYVDDELGGIVMSTSRDGGRVWSKSVPVVFDSATSQDVNGGQPLIRPDGTIVVAYTALAPVPAFGRHEIAVTRSVDGGASFGQQIHVADIYGDDFLIYGVRAPQFVSGDVDAGGTVYLSWHDCDPDYCIYNGILLAKSADGMRWSAPARIRTAPSGSPADSLLPGLAVAPGTKNGRARIAITYYTRICTAVAPCSMDAFLIRSPNGGRTWGARERLNSESMRMWWLADTNIGVMVGDYISTSFAGRRVIPVLALATTPVAGHRNEAIFAARLPG